MFLGVWDGGTWKLTGCVDGILSFATIALAIRVPRMTNAKQQQAAIIVWSAVMYGMYGFLLRVFHIKNGGYPFHLPPL